MSGAKNVQAPETQLPYILLHEMRAVTRKCVGIRLQCSHSFFKNGLHQLFQVHGHCPALAGPRTPVGEGEAHEGGGHWDVVPGTAQGPFRGFMSDWLRWCPCATVRGWWSWTVERQVSPPAFLVHDC